MWNIFLIKLKGKKQKLFNKGKFKYNEILNFNNNNKKY